MEIILNVMKAVCDRIGLHLKGFDEGNKKRKFLVKSIPDDKLFPNYQELNVVHNYLSSNSPGMGQARIRKSGQSGKYCLIFLVFGYMVIMKILFIKACGHIRIQ